MGRARSTHEKKNAYRILLRKPERKSPLRRHRCRWENIKMNLTKIGWGGMAYRDHWTVLVNMVMNFRVP
jgi:hypothetical protein